MDKQEVIGFYTRNVSIENVTFERAKEDSDIIEFSFSSELPVERWWGTEILSHDPGCVNLERATTMNFLWNHDRNMVLGKCEEVTLKEDKRGYCKVRWSKKKSIEEYKQDVADGILTNVSFAYTIDDVREVMGCEDDDPVYFCSWTPLEISLVSVPQDASVGIGRALSVSENNLEDTKNSGRAMEITEIREQESKRIASILELANTYGEKELANKLINEGAAIEAARSAYLPIATSQAQTPVASIPLGLSPKEEKTYSIARAINAFCDNDWSGAGFERECSREIAKRTGREPKGFFVPVFDLNVSSRAAYAAGANDTGAYTVQTDLLVESFIELLRNKTTVIQAGATMLSGLNGPVAIPTQATAASTYWVAENGSITQSEATFGQVPLNAKTIAARSQFSRLMLLQSSIGIEQFIRNDFARIIAIGIDLAAISGSGSSNQPTGILNTSGIGSVALGTNGAAPTWASLVNLIREIEIDNAGVDGMKWLTNPKVKAKLMQTSKQGSGVEGNFILSDPNSLMGYDFLVTNQVSSALTKGSGSALSAIIFGNFSDLLIGEWGALEVLPNPYGSGFNSGAIDIRVMQTIDIAVRHAESFAAIVDAITT
jgi:HK97 family phage major capsid protein/HK97 family phage prohead protease